MAAKKKAPAKKKAASSGSDRGAMTKAQEAKRKVTAKAASPRGAIQTGAGFIRNFKGNVSDNAGFIGAKTGSKERGYDFGRTAQRSLDQRKRALDKKKK